MNKNVLLKLMNFNVVSWIVMIEGYGVRGVIYEYIGNIMMK